MRDLRADRSLLLPGPHPPLSHLGATLLRHVVHVALRYALYQLGWTAPEGAPTRFVGLRLYLDVPKLRKCAPENESGREILGALIQPGNAAETKLAPADRGKLFFHRLRLKTKPPALRTERGPGADATPPLDEFRSLLSVVLSQLGDAVLAEILTAIDRREQRLSGRVVPPALGHEAARYMQGEKGVALSRLGLPDPKVGSWHHQLPDEARAQPDGVSAQALSDATPDRHRGTFRELYRESLDRLRVPLFRLADDAARGKLIASPEDIFFIPLDLLSDLVKADKPTWLRESIENNRQEWNDLQNRNAPLDSLGTLPQLPKALDLPQNLFPLSPLP